MAIQQHSKYKKPNKLIILFLLISVLMVGAALLFGKNFYNRIYASNVIVTDNALFYIPSGSDFEDVTTALNEGKYLRDAKAFEWVARKKNYVNKVIPGRYKLKNGWSNNTLVNTLRSGNRSPVRVTFNNIRTMPELAGAVSRYLECDSIDLITHFNKADAFKSYGFTQAASPALFIPNTYELWWTTRPEGFVKRMHQEYNKFWTDERKRKAEKAGLSPIEVSTLAAIVDEETVKADEKADVAGLYINRLNKNIRLQADPTVKYAMGNFAIQRVLKKDLQTNSLYNTYLHAGLPPGPIRIPSVSGLEAVLNYTRHQYLFMCAKEDFSGYHNFAKTLKQHNINAAKFQKALNSNRIYR